MSRISERFARLKAEGRVGLIPFIMAGDKNEKFCAELLKALPKAGADFIELGIPFSDPMADGITIQLAGQRAIAAGTTLKTVLRLVTQFRVSDAQTPIILMGYYNPLYAYGISEFLTEAARAGVDGLIMVDLPPEEAEELYLPALEKNIDLVRLIAPTTRDARIGYIANHASGFLYYISVTGVTGTKSSVLAEVQTKIAAVRRHSDLPVAMGFGIRTAEQAGKAAQLADAVVVGSALVEIIAKNDTYAEALAFVRELAVAVRQVKK